MNLKLIMSKKNLGLLVVFGMGIIAIGIDALPTESAESVNISVTFGACDPNVLPLYVALENGYFAEENINVNQSQLNNPIYTTAIAKPNTDVIVIGRGMFYRLQDVHPGTFRVFNINLQDENKWNDAIIVNKESEISSLSQLKGKVLGFLTSDEEKVDPKPVAIRMMLEKNGLNPAEFTLTTAHLQDLENNTIGAFYIREPSLALALHSGKQEILVEGPIFAKYVFSPWPMSVSALSAEFIEQKPETARKVVQVWDRAINFIRENPAEADKLLEKCIKENYGQDGVKVSQINYWKSNEIDKNLIQKQLKWYYSIGVTEKELNVNDILY